MSPIPSQHNAQYEHSSVPEEDTWDVKNMDPDRPRIFNAKNSGKGYGGGTPTGYIKATVSQVEAVHFEHNSFIVIDHPIGHDASVERDKHHERGDVTVNGKRELEPDMTDESEKENPMIKVKRFKRSEIKEGPHGVQASYNMSFRGESGIVQNVELEKSSSEREAGLEDDDKTLDDLKSPEKATREKERSPFLEIDVAFTNGGDGIVD